MHILLVEDDESIREIFKLVLETERPLDNLEVEVAASGQEAVACVKAKRPDVVLLDLTLPEEHGFDVYRKLQALKPDAHLPVIAVTAHNLTDLQIEAKNLGFFGYVTKPIDFENSLYPLLKQLHTSLNRSVA
jgi:CheY-like chemotaxis protein